MEVFMKYLSQHLSKLLVDLSEEGLVKKSLSSAITSDWETNFLVSLRQQFKKKGRLSDKQIEILERIAVKLLTPHKVKPSWEEETLSNMKKVLDLLSKVKNNGSLWLNFKHLDYKQIKMYRATSRSKYEGQIQIIGWLAGDDGNKDYFGRIDETGNLCLYKAGKAVKKELVDLLTKLAEDPAKVVAEYGHTTGRCSFCRQSLSDEISKHVGYGQWCAKKYQLTYPTKKQFQQAMQKNITSNISVIPAQVGGV